MESKNSIKRHCPEVETLMDGKMPFVTRHGITLVVIVLIIVAVFVFTSDGVTCHFLKEAIGHIIEQIKIKF